MKPKENPRPKPKTKRPPAPKGQSPIIKLPIVVAVSGYFDPLHIGHINYLRSASMLGESLYVILNNDEQLIKKKGYVFMPMDERKEILQALSFVNVVLKCVDTDGSVCETLKRISPDIFCNGGDRNNKEIPEAKVCKELGIEIVDGLGKKIASSSELVKKSKEKK